MKLSTWLVVGFVAIILGGHLGCASAPPNLTQPGRIAWENHRYQSYMDTARDVATAVSQVPPAAQKPVVVWHRSAITILHGRADGWKASILTGLDELRGNLPPAQQMAWGNYLDAIRVVLTFAIREEPPTDASVIAAYEAAYTNSKAIDDAWLVSHGS